MQEQAGIFSKTNSDEAGYDYQENHRSIAGIDHRHSQRTIKDRLPDPARSIYTGSGNGYR